MPALATSARIFKTRPIHSLSSSIERYATVRFLALPMLSVVEVNRRQRVYAPGKPIHYKAGMIVWVGNYVAAGGGPAIPRKLRATIADTNAK